MNCDLTKPIPERPMPDGDFAVLEKAAEPFVDIADFSGGVVAVEMKYYEQKIAGAVNKAYMRKGAAQRLMKAAELLPRGIRFKVYDAWRPYAVQKKLYDDYFNRLSQREENIGMTEAELHSLTRQFVSYPDPEKELTYVHSCGGAIDLTLIDESGRELDMGCGFDDFTDMANTAYFEHTDHLARDNRRILYNVMTSVGFTNFPSEWWHFDFGDMFWSAFTGSPAVYASVFHLREEDII